MWLVKMHLHFSSQGFGAGPSAKCTQGFLGASICSFTSFFVWRICKPEFAGKPLPQFRSGPNIAYYVNKTYLQMKNQTFEISRSCR